MKYFIINKRQESVTLNNNKIKINKIFLYSVFSKKKKKKKEMVKK